eukprot:m.175366 g.175366  ORF g.175366 m.175366 type:complete len:460 (+) comp17345_c0_seq2:299-1678(+)
MSHVERMPLPKNVRYPLWRQAVSLAVLSRCCVLTLTALSFNVFASYDRSLALEQAVVATEGSFVDKTLFNLFAGLGTWDGVFFRRIAAFGYEHEQFLAFFPLYPSVVRLVSWPLSFALHTHMAILAAAVLVSNLCFIASVAAFYALSVQTVGSAKTAWIATVLYVWNPSAVFMSAAYSESIFALFCFLGLLALQRHKDWVAALCFALCAAARSNGIVFAGMFVVKELLLLRRVSRLLRLCGLLALVASPSLLFQYVSYQRICSQPNPDQALCGQSLPNPYFYIQAKYWNIGLFNYFAMSQVPNFVLALPMFLWSCWSVRFACMNRLPRSLHAILVHAADSPLAGLVAVQVWFTVIAFSVMHVQVVTRFLCCSSPLLYWAVAWYLESEAETKAATKAAATATNNTSKNITNKSNSSNSRITTKDDGSCSFIPNPPLQIFRMCVVFFCLGCILFPCFYPWT